MLSRLSSFSGPLSKLFTAVFSNNPILSLDAATYSGSGPWIDVIGGKSFTLYNNPTYVNTDEKYFYFSSNNSQYAQSSTSLPSLPVFTLELWHRWDGINIGGQSCLITEVFANGVINYFLGSPGGVVADGGYFNGGFQLTPQFGLTASNWYQIVMTCDSSKNIRIYVNNTLISTTSSSGTQPSSSSGGIRLMRRWDNPDYWGGSVGLVNIYNTALDSTIIEEKWNLNKVRFGFTDSGFTTNGLILRYEISDIDSYSGASTVTDLIGNSNATLTNGPTYSINGYINFDGTNDYLSTNTSLNSKLLPVNTSKFISHFVWIYPTDNGVIVSEIGQTTPNTLWHDSQIEIVGGNLKFGLWTLGGLSSLNSSISTPFYNWYYVGLTYDGTTMRGYVNGQLAGTKNLSRLTPYNGSSVGLHYAIASSDSTSLGDGTPAKMKLGAFHVYNSTLSEQQVLNNYNYTKSNYIYTGSMSIWIDANDPASFSGGSITDLSGNGYTHSLIAGATLSTMYGIKSFDCTTGNKRIVVNGTGPTLPTTGYTYVVWAKIISSNSSFRTLLYTNSPKYTPITIPNGTNTLGYWDTAFRSSGYDISSLADTWVQYSVVGDNSSQTFYINDSQVGSSISYGSGGTTHWGLGNNDLAGQPFGHVGNMMLYNKKLTLDQIKQNYDALKNVYVEDGPIAGLWTNGGFSANSAIEEITWITGMADGIPEYNITMGSVNYPFITNGNGTGAQINVVITANRDENDELVDYTTIYYLSSAGTGYQLGDTLTLLGIYFSEMDPTPGLPNVVITVTSIS